MQRPTVFRIIGSLVAFLLALPALGRGDSQENLSSAIDRLIEARQQAEAVSHTGPIDDYAFARRVTLDLAGRIPTLQELTGFVADTSVDKRRQLVDRLLASPDFAYHLRDSLDILLLARKKTDEPWRKYLLEAARENRSWDRIFREVMLPERELPGDKRPAAFLHARARDLDAMTNDASVLWFGVNIACAKCHDHPLVPDWEQSHYFALASFFQRTFPTRTGLVSEKFDGKLKFTTTEGEEHQAEFMFLSGTSVSEPETALDKDVLKEIGQKIRDAERKEDAPPPPQPEFSPRAELVRLALEPGEHDFFSHNMANRVWARLIGHGLVHPLDQMHSENPPSHPELLETLAQDFAQNGYDLKRLIRTIVLTRTYFRSSRWTDASEPADPELFARGMVRPLYPRQLAMSLRVATRNPNGMPGLSAPDQWMSAREKFEQDSTALAARLPIPSGLFQVGTEEALFFSNSQEFHEDFLDSGNEHLVGHLAELADPEQIVETAFLTVLSRPPSDTEKGAVALHLAQRADQREDALRQLVWALLASPEFRFNH